MDKKLKSYSVTSSDGHFRPMVRLAYPVLAEEVLTLLVGWTDLWLVGQYVAGEESKAAMGLMSYVMWLIPSLFAAVSIGAVALVSRNVGADKRKLANLFANQAFTLGIAFCLVATILCFWFYKPFIQSMNLTGLSAGYASRYLSYVVPVIPLIMIQQVGVASLRGAGDTLTGLIVKSLVVLLNMFVSVTLVTGISIFPEMGFDGIAIGTAIGHGTGGLIMLFILCRGRAGIKLQLPMLKPQYKLSKKLLKIGLPGAFDIAAVLTCQLVFLSFVNSLGTLQAASHAVAIQIEALSFLPGSAFQVAAATMAGQFLGAKLPARAKKSVWVCSLSGIAVMTSTGLIVYLFAKQIAGFFIHSVDQETITLASELLRIICWAMPALAIVMIMSGALRGSGDTKWPFMITLVGFLLIRIPLAYYLALDSPTFFGHTVQGMGLGIYGAWYAMLVDIVCRGLFLLFRVLHGGWLKTKV